MQVCTKLLNLVAVATSLSGLLGQTTLRTSTEVAPPGGVAQVKLLSTSPQPISSGTIKADLDATFLDDIIGIALFSLTGDVAGAAVVNGRQFKLELSSPNRTFGTALDYPLLTVAVGVGKNALPGQFMPVNLASAALIVDASGKPVVFESKPGSLTVGGTLSINNVVPGGGLIPAGYPVRVLGMGFTPKSKVKVKEEKLDSVSFVSAGELVIRFQTDVRLDGKLIIVTRPDNAQASYYSYLRGLPLGFSSHPLVAHTVPVFSSQTFIDAVLPPTIPTQVNAAYVTAVAVQNPNLGGVQIALELFSGKTRIARRALELAPGMRFVREISELFGVAAPTGSVVRVVCSEPVQVLGLLGNIPDASMRPLAAISVPPGTFHP